MSDTEDGEVTSMKMDLDSTLHIKNVKYHIEKKKDIYIQICPSALSLKLKFGRRKKGWVSLSIFTKPYQTYFFSQLNLTVYRDGEGGAKTQLAARSAKDKIVEDGRSLEWSQFISLQNLIDVEDFQIVLQSKQERKATSLPVQVCCDPSLHRDMLEILDLAESGPEEAGGDIQFVFGERKLSAHKSILMQRSEYFRAMFESGLEESKTNVIKIDEDEGVFHELLDYWYSGMTPTNIDTISWELIEVAHRYQAQDIVDKCEFSIRAKLKVDHVIPALVLADRYDCARLKEASIDLITKNIKDVRKTEDFAELIKHPKLMFEVFCASVDDESN